MDDLDNAMAASLAWFLNLSDYELEMGHFKRDVLKKQLALIIKPYLELLK